MAAIERRGYTLESAAGKTIERLLSCGRERSCAGNKFEIFWWHMEVVVECSLLFGGNLQFETVSVSRPYGSAP